ncbi:hypothetical protein JXB11_03315 [Candidatus Woesearchaeota archaeon]|nr:hypothetical protein [Candidatus Woesearchaeota archaeon]
MKHAIMLAILVVIIAVGCTKVQEPPAQTPAISGTTELILNEQDLQQLGMTSNLNEQDLEQLGITGGTNCWTDEAYSNIVDSSLGQYTVCAYLIPALNDTQVIIQLQKFADYEALNGSYQYDSSHLYGAKGLISENAFGDQSRFRVNNGDDYGAEFNPPGVYYYHLWIAKDLYLIHITSSGTEEAEGQIAEIGKQILSKF